MRRLKFKTLLAIVIVSISVLGGSLLVSASRAKDREHPVKAKYIDPNGSEIVIYEEELYIDDKYDEGVHDVYTVQIEEDEEYETE